MLLTLQLYTLCYFLHVCLIIDNNLKLDWTGGEETRCGTEKRFSNNLQSGHPAWWSADNYSIFPTVNILEARIEANWQRKSEMLKKIEKNYIMQLCFFCISYLSFGTEMWGELKRNRAKSCVTLFSWLVHK